MNSFSLKDRNDNSGFGMFSKAGRFTSEIHGKALKQLRNFQSHSVNKESKKTITQPDDEYKTLDQDIVQEDISQATEKEEVRNSVQQEQGLFKPSEKQDQPFGRMISREKAQTRLLDKHKTPPCGQYNPKVTFIRPSPKLIMSFAIPQNKSRIERNQTRPLSQQSYFSQDKKVKGYYMYDTLLSRDKCYSLKTEPSDNTYDYKYNTLQSNQNHRPSVHFGKQIGRKYQPNISPDLSYSPGYSQVERRTVTMGTSFMKQSQRRPNFNNVTCLNSDQNYEHDQWNLSISSIYPNTKKSIINFHHMIGRDKFQVKKINDIDAKPLSFVDPVSTDLRFRCKTQQSSGLKIKYRY